jgi:hypothetical protein
MRHYQASAMQYLQSDQRALRLKMFEGIQNNISMSEMKNGTYDNEGNMYN